MHRVAIVGSIAGLGRTAPLGVGLTRNTLSRQYSTRSVGYLRREAERSSAERGRKANSEVVSNFFLHYSNNKLSLRMGRNNTQKRVIKTKVDID